MYTRFATALLFAFVAFGITSAFVVPDCGSNAEFLRCGSACVPDCANPEEPKMCTLQCVMGCFCKKGFLKNAQGQCVRPENCEAQTQPEAIQMPQCPQNEEFKTCGSACAPTCANPNGSPICTRQCVIGCFCKPGFLRNKYHVCVPAEQCDKPNVVPQQNFAYPPDHTPMPVVPEVCADENEEFRQCKGCDGTCDKPHPICPRICLPGCACKRGHVRGANGKCIKLEQCPKAQLNILMMMPPVCKQNEVFLTCGTACPATCDNPHPSAICTKNCVIGCFCKEGYLRHANGECVPMANCEAQPAAAKLETVTRPYGDDMLCPGGPDREVYIDDDLATQYDCVQSCDTPLPYMIRGHVQIPKKCQEVKPGSGCVCRFPFYRNEEGKCVERKECHKTEMTTMTPAH